MPLRSWTLLVLLLGGAATLPSATLYSVTDIGTLGADTYGSGINNAGQITGVSGGYAFLYSNGVMTSIGTFTPTAINNAGQIAGYSGGPGSGYMAILYSNGVVTDLGLSNSIAYGINNAGQVVGRYEIAYHTLDAFLYSNGVVTDLGTLGSSGVNSVSEARGINNAGQITGYSTIESTPTTSGPSHAFLYSNGVMTDLNIFGGVYSQGNAINNAGQVTGWAFDSSNPIDNSRHAFLYSNGVATSLGGFNSQGTAINNAGQVVGTFFTTGGDQHAFLYSDGMMVDLNSLIDRSSGISSGIVFDEAWGINDSGQILAGAYFGGRRRTYLLTPVPEPGTWALLGAGLLALGALSRQQWRKQL